MADNGHKATFVPRGERDRPCDADWAKFEVPYKERKVDRRLMLSGVLLRVRNSKGSDHLTRAAEQNYPVIFARMAMLQAIHRNDERVFNPDRKDPHWGRRKLKRDQ